MSNKKFKFDFRIIIHTCQMLSSYLEYDAEKLEIINNKQYIIKPNARYTKKGCLFPINANKLHNKEIISLTEFLKTIEYIQSDLNIDEWTFDRIDFAFDTTLKFDSIIKYSLYITCLLSNITGIKNAIDIQDINTKKKRAFTLKSPKFEFQIYDKALESKNKHPYSRFEFRFKNISNADIYTVTERLKGIIENLVNSIEAVEQQRINDLYTLWQKESRNGCITQTKNFSEFVRRYNNDIFTRGIAKGLYIKINNGNFENWLKKFKRNNEIFFVNKSDIETISNTMKKALNSYIKQDT